MKAPRTVAARCGQKPARTERLPFMNPGALVSMGGTHHSDSLTFTAEEHLEVQQKIEQRARELWRQRGGLPGNALNDWLRAEEEVVVGFIRIRIRSDVLQPPISCFLPPLRFNSERK